VIKMSETQTEYKWSKILTEDDILNLIYPVGSIYMSVNSTSPASLFGGTWEQIKDKFLLSSGDTYSNGATGGEATHTLSTNEMPTHNHESKSLTGYVRTIVYNGNNSPNGIVSKNGSCANDRTMTSKSSGGFGAQGFNITATHTHNNNGGGQAHNNMPPYLTVNVWKRTA